MWVGHDSEALRKHLPTIADHVDDEVAMHRMDGGMGGHPRGRRPASTARAVGDRLSGRLKSFCRSAWPSLRDAARFNSLLRGRLPALLRTIA